MEPEGEYSQYHKGRLLFCYASKALQAEGWAVAEMGIHPDSPQHKECTGKEHKRLLYAGATTKTYVPSAIFRVTTAKGRVAYLCRECVGILGEAVLQRDKERIAALWPTFRTTLMGAEDEEAEFERAVERGAKTVKPRRRVQEVDDAGETD